MTNFAALHRTIRNAKKKSQKFQPGSKTRRKAEAAAAEARKEITRLNRKNRGD